MPSQGSLISGISPLQARLEDRFRGRLDCGSVFKRRIEKRLRGEVDTEQVEAKQPEKGKNVWAPRNASDFASTTIQRHLRDGFYSHPVRGEQRFRSRYRVPFSVYEQFKADLVALDPSLNPFFSKARRRGNLVPLDNKILTFLRILGRGVAVQDDLDHSGMSVDNIRKTFKKNCATDKR